ncbi:MAG: agmatine deiminase family protein [Bryobacteraceae bacterium]
MEQLFTRYLGIRETIWLKNGIAGDDTHGHVDDLARFSDPCTVVLAIEQERSEVNFEPLQENLKLLQKQKDSLKVIPLPMPQPVWFDEQRLPASYANFYIANGLVLVPTFNHPNDRVALGILSSCFPDREVVGIHCGDLILGLGALHCMTQQQIA